METIYIKFIRRGSEMMTEKVLYQYFSETSANLLGQIKENPPIEAKLNEIIAAMEKKFTEDGWTLYDLGEGPGLSHNNLLRIHLCQFLIAAVCPPKKNGHAV
jgi:hypothetical protein